MISKIKDTTTSLIQQYQKNETVKHEADKAIGIASASTETVNLSNRAKDIQQVRQLLERTPDLREDKVVELKSQIENGTYEIKPEKIAEKMLGESLIDLFA